MQYHWVGLTFEPISLSPLTAFASIDGVIMVQIQFMEKLPRNGKSFQVLVIDSTF